MKQQRAIFITGAASGIGRATAVLFHEKGWFVGCYDVDEDALQRLQKELGSGCVTSCLDVRDKVGFDLAVAGFAEHTGSRLDVMFNNAGIAVGGHFEEMPFDKIMDMVNTNFIGVLNGIYAAIPLLKQTENSLCFTTSSSAATFGAPGLAVYAATKFGVKGLTEALSVELARYGSRAADVLPGIIDTAIWKSDRYVDGEVASTFESVPRMNAGRSDASRTIAPSEVAACVWNAYHGNELHWYVPPELVEREREKLESPERMRDEMITQRRQ